MVGASGPTPGIAPHGDGRVHLWAVVPAGGPAASDLDALRRRLAGWHDPIPALLDRADPASALLTELRWLPPLRRTVAGRTVLVGDAAHAMTGAGRPRAPGPDRGHRPGARRDPGLAPADVRGRRATRLAS